mgnify:CR=1 FL=1
MDMLVRRAAEFNVEIPRWAQGESGGAFDMEMGRGRLVKLGLLIVEFAEDHGRAAGLKGRSSCEGSLHPGYHLETGQAHRD